MATLCYSNRFATDIMRGTKACKRRENLGYKCALPVYINDGEIKSKFLHYDALRPFEDWIKRIKSL